MHLRFLFFCISIGCTIISGRALYLEVKTSLCYADDNLRVTFTARHILNFSSLRQLSTVHTAWSKSWVFEILTSGRRKERESFDLKVLTDFLILIRTGASVVCCEDIFWKDWERYLIKSDGIFLIKEDLTVKLSGREVVQIRLKTQRKKKAHKK